MTTVQITRTPNHAKAFKAVFTTNGKTKITRFGTDSNYVLNPNKTAADRAAYLARHKVNENWNDFMSAGALSRWILWGESRSLNKNISSFKKRFKL